MPGHRYRPPAKAQPRRRRWARSATAVLGTAVLAFTGCTSTSSPTTDTTWNHIDLEPGVSVDVPVGWMVAASNLTPNLSHPLEVFSAGTFELRRGGDCAQIPPRALSDMGSSDVFVSLQEATPRPAPERTTFTSASGLGKGELEFVDCLTDDDVRDIGRLRWIAFAEHDRSFYLLVAIGVDAAGDRVEDVWALANGIEVAAAEPGMSVDPSANGTTP